MSKEKNLHLNWKKIRNLLFLPSLGFVALGAVACVATNDQNSNDNLQIENDKSILRRFVESEANNFPFNYQGVKENVLVTSLTSKEARSNFTLESTPNESIQLRVKNVQINNSDLTLSSVIINIEASLGKARRTYQQTISGFLSPSDFLQKTVEGLKNDPSFVAATPNSKNKTVEELTRDDFQFEGNRENVRVQLENEITTSNQNATTAILSFNAIFINDDPQSPSFILPFNIAIPGFQLFSVPNPGPEENPNPNQKPNLPEVKPNPEPEQPNPDPNPEPEQPNPNPDLTPPVDPPSPPVTPPSPSDEEIINKFFNENAESLPSANFRSDVLENVRVTSLSLADFTLSSQKELEISFKLKSLTPLDRHQVSLTISASLGDLNRDYEQTISGFATNLPTTFDFSNQQIQEITTLKTLNDHLSILGNGTLEIQHRFGLDDPSSHFNERRDFIGTNLDGLNQAPQMLVPSPEIISAAQDNLLTQEINLDALDDLILNNPFGQNATMFAWYLLTISDNLRSNETITVNNHKFFNFNDSRNINNVLFYAQNVSNSEGSLDLYVTYDLDNAHHVTKVLLNRTNSALKGDLDYRQYISDRSFRIFTEYGGYENQNDDPDDNLNDTFSHLDATLESPFDRISQTVNNSNTLQVPSVFARLPHSAASTGTAWLVDRITNDPSLKEDEFAFVAATNKHVLDLTSYLGRFDSSFNSGFKSYQGPLSPEEEQERSKQLSYLRNSGIKLFRWSRIQNDDTTNFQQLPINSDDSNFINNIQDTNQLLTTRISNLHRIVNVEEPIRFANGTNNFSAKGPTWLLNGRKNLLNSFLYSTEFNLERSNLLNSDFTNPSFDPLVENLPNGSTTTLNAGSDLVFFKVVLKRADIEKDWKPLLKVIDEPSLAKQRAWFPKFASTLNDGRQSLYVAGYPGIQDNRKIENQVYTHAFDFRNINTSVFYSDTNNYSLNSNTVRPFWNAFSEERKRLREKNGIVSKRKIHLNYPFDDEISNPQSGMYDNSILLGTQTFTSGTHMEPGTSGSLVVNGNFEGVAVMRAFTTYTAPSLDDSSQNERVSYSLLSNFMQNNPYALSQLRPDKRANAILDLYKKLELQGVNTLNGPLINT